MDRIACPIHHSRAEEDAYIEQCMQGERLDIDAIRNAISYTHYCLVLGLHRLMPLQNYREMLQEREPTHVDALMHASLPAAIAEYDALINAFNADLERIKAENDVEAVRNVVRRTLEISKGISE